MPSRPSSSTRGPVSERTAGSVRAVMAPARRRSTYQGRRSTPCDWCPQRSACTRLSATRAASSSGTPEATSTCVLKARRDPGDRRGTEPPLDVVRPTVYILYTKIERTAMFSLVVQMEIRPGRREEFLAGMAANAAASVREEPGCLRFDICSVDGDEHRFVLYELYRDADAFAAHKTAPHFAQWRTVAERVLVGQVSTTGSLLVTHTAEESA